MKKYLLVLSIVGISTAQISIADVEISNKKSIYHSSGSPNNTNTTITKNSALISSDREINQIIENLKTQAENQAKAQAEQSKKDISTEDRIKDLIQKNREISPEKQRYESRMKEIQRIVEAARIRREILAKRPNPKIGMTREQILYKSNWGEPQDINTTIDAYGTFEQWIYGGSKYLYFKNGMLTSIQY